MNQNIRPTLNGRLREWHSSDRLALNAVRLSSGNVKRCAFSIMVWKVSQWYLSRRDTYANGRAEFRLVLTKRWRHIVFIWAKWINETLNKYLQEPISYPPILYSVIRTWKPRATFICQYKLLRKDAQHLQTIGIDLTLTHMRHWTKTGTPARV